MPDNLIQPTNQPPAQSNQSSTTSGVVDQTADSKKQNLYEMILFCFGALAIVSLLVNNGFFMKLTGSIFLLVAVIAIIRSLSKPKQIIFQSSPSGGVEMPKKRRRLKIIVTILVLLLIIPVLPYLAFMAFLLIAMLFGGGNANFGS